MTLSRGASLVRRAAVTPVASRFLLTGALVAAVHLLLAAGLILAGVHPQVALVVTFAVVLSLHFTLNRQWVFAPDQGYALHLSRQGFRYLTVAGISYVVTAVAIAILPEALDVPVLAIFLVVTAIMACVNFLLLRLWVFRSVEMAG